MDKELHHPGSKRVRLRSAINIGFYVVEKPLNSSNTPTLTVKGGELNRLCLRWQTSLRPDCKYSNSHFSPLKWTVLNHLQLK